MTGQHITKHGPSHCPHRMKIQGDPQAITTTYSYNTSLVSSPRSSLEVLLDSLYQHSHFSQLLFVMHREFHRTTGTLLGGDLRWLSSPTHSLVQGYHQYQVNQPSFCLAKFITPPQSQIPQPPWTTWPSVVLPSSRIFLHVQFSFPKLQLVGIAPCYIICHYQGDVGCITFASPFKQI